MLGVGVFALPLTGLLGCVYKYHEKKIVLEFGMLTGSNWDVASASSFVIIDKAITGLEGEHPGMKIHYYSGINKESYSEWCARRLLERKTPDVFMVPDSNFNLYSPPGVPKNLDKLIKHDAGFDRNDFFTTALDTGRCERHQYTPSYETVPVLLSINKSLLVKEQVGVPGEDWIWDDMCEICRGITRDVNGDELLDQSGTYNYSRRNMIYTSGGRFYDGDQKQLPFTDSHVLDATRCVKCLNDLNQGQSVTQEDFNRGNVTFMPLALVEYGTYKTYPHRIKKYTKFQWDCVTFPAGKERENRSRVDSLLIGIDSNTKHEKLAWELLKQLTGGEEMQTDISRYSQRVSVFKNVTGSTWTATITQGDMDEEEQTISSSLLYNATENGIIESKFQQYEQAMSLAGGEVSKILIENRSVGNSMKIFQRNVAKYLQ